MKKNSNSNNKKANNFHPSQSGGDNQMHNSKQKESYTNSSGKQKQEYFPYSSQPETNANHKASLSSMLKSIFRSSLFYWILSVPFASIAAYLTIFGYLVPRISVEPPGIVDSAEPYKSFFKVQNQGYWAINDIFYVINIKDCFLNDDGKGYLELSEKTGEWLSYGPGGLIRNKPVLEPLQVDTPSIEFTSNTFEELCRNGREMVLQIDYTPDFYPFRKTKCFRFRLEHPDSQRAQWVPIANRNDFNPHFNAKDTNKAWVILGANANIFKSKDIVPKSDQIVLIGIPPDRRQ
jgi:hypothetical protein